MRVSYEYGLLSVRFTGDMRRLKDKIAAFRTLFGIAPSIGAHGDESGNLVDTEGEIIFTRGSRGQKVGKLGKKYVQILFENEKPSMVLPRANYEWELYTRLD